MDGMIKRQYLMPGTLIKLNIGECYRITGMPLGEGGGSIVYPCEKITLTNGISTVGNLKYAIKECYPISSNYKYVRNYKHEIVPELSSNAAISYLQTVKRMHMHEHSITEIIYNTSSSMIPILSGSNQIEISIDDGKTFHFVNNTMTVMPSLELKGYSIKYHLRQESIFSLQKALQLVKLILLSVKEVHDAGFLHLDIQDGNIFVKGSLTEENLVSLIDFGSARRILPDGLTDVIQDCVVFSTNGFSAPEILEKNDGTLRLGKEADIYSVGYLLLLMLTGKYYSQLELNSLDIRRILTGRKIRKMNCPNHMADKLRQIVSCALNKSPENRYHSCDEMISGISELLDAMQPYKSAISQVLYDAFICYRHGSIDSPIAKILQQCLEHFHCPMGLTLGKRKINKVFVDEGELSSCADFGLQIHEAIKNSEWLIVICSPGTKQSPWVNLEIQTFLKYHDRSHILALITEGEALEVFPEELLGQDSSIDGVLAADARADSLYHISRKVKKDAVIKIAAPILGLPYDSLKQRQKKYLLRRIYISATCVLALVNLFFLYSINKNFKIREQQNIIQKNLAQNYVDQSAAFLQMGKREKAIQSVLAIDDISNDNSPIIPEQIYALNNALYNYHYFDDMRGFRPSKEIALEDTKVDTILLNESGNILFCIDNQATAYFYDTSEFSLLWKCQITNSSTFEEIQLYESRFISDTELWIFSNIAIFKLDLTKKNCNTFSLNHGIDSENDYSYENGILVIKDYPNTLYIYDTMHMSMRTYILDTDEFDFSCITLSPDGTMLAISNSNESSAAVQSLDLPVKSKGILLLDLNSGEEVILNTQSYVYSLIFVTNYEIATIEYEFLDSEVSGLNDKVRYYENVYDLDNGKTFRNGLPYVMNFWVDEPNHQILGAKIQNVKLSDHVSDVILLYWGTHLLLIDNNTFQLLEERSFTNNILDAYAYNENDLLVGLSDGSVWRITYGTAQEVFSLHLPTEFLICNPTAQLIIQLTDQESIFVSKIAKDDKMKLVKSDTFSFPKLNQNTRINGNNSDRYAILEDGFINVYEKQNATLLLCIPIAINKQDRYSPLFTFFNNDSLLIVYTQDNILSIWDIVSGNLVSTLNLEMDEYIKDYILTDYRGSYFALYTNDGQVFQNEKNELLQLETNIFYVDNNYQIHSYADVPNGYVDFEQNLIYSKSKTAPYCYYNAPFYDYYELKDEAQRVISP